MQRRDKVKLQELIDYWKHVASNPSKTSSLLDTKAKSFALLRCATELETVLAGENTVATGFRPPKRK